MCDILLLEDNHSLREVAADVLTEEGLEVREAFCVWEAAALIREDRCKILIADHDLGTSDMPDGFTFAREVLRRFPDVCVIYTTGETELLPARPLSSRERSLPKPYLPAELLELTRELLDLQPASRRASGREAVPHAPYAPLPAREQGDPARVRR